MNNNDIHDAALPALIKPAKTDDNTLVRAAAISALAKLKDPVYMSIFKDASNSR